METQIIFEAIREIKESVEIINGELGEIQVDVAVLKTQMAELMWWTRAIFGAFIILFISQIWKKIITFKNNINGKKI